MSPKRQHLIKFLRAISFFVSSNYFMVFMFWSNPRLYILCSPWANAKHLMFENVLVKFSGMLHPLGFIKLKMIDQKKLRKL